MAMLLEYLPLILFFAAYKLYGILEATATVIVATLALVALQWLRTRTVNRMQLAVAGLVVVFGGSTLLLGDGIYIQWKPTVVYWLFGLVFLGSRFTGTTVLERLLGRQLAMPAPIWRRLNDAWMVFWFAMGGLNLYFVYQFSEATWVNFKLFGTLGLTFAFLIAQGLWIARAGYLPDQEE